MRRLYALTLITLLAAGPLAGLLWAAPALAAGGSGTSTTAGSTATTPAATAPASSPVAPDFSLGSAEDNAITTATTTTAATSSSTSSSSGGLSGTDAILIGVVTVALLLGISAFVVRDARIRTRRDPDVSDDPFAAKRKGSKAPPKSRKLTPAERKRRKRGRAARRR